MEHRQNWETYSKRLIDWGYTEEELEKVKQTRNSLEYMTFEQFDFLFRQGVIIRKAKLKKPRNLYVNNEGEVLYLNHHLRQYQVCGVFAE